MGQTICDVHQEFGLTGKVAATTTDNGATCEAAFSRLNVSGGGLEEEEEEEAGGGRDREPQMEAGGLYILVCSTKEILPTPYNYIPYRYFLESQYK